jgi:hypothetical protein
MRQIVTQVFSVVREDTDIGKPFGDVFGNRSWGRRLPRTPYLREWEAVRFDALTKMPLRGFLRERGHVYSHDSIDSAIGEPEKISKNESRMLSTSTDKMDELTSRC